MWNKCTCYSLAVIVFIVHMLLQIQLWIPARQDNPLTNRIIVTNQISIPQFSPTNIPPLLQPDIPESTMHSTDINTFVRTPTRILSGNVIFNCSNIADISIRHKLGQGVSKQVYLGMYNGYKVAVKMVTKSSLDVKSCLSQISRDGYELNMANKRKCYDLTSYKLIKELLLLQQLHHSNIMQLLGYCVRSEETESLSLDDHGVVIVYEYGLPFYVSSIRRWPWHLRHKTALELTHLLTYLEHSPIGSVVVADFKADHFLMKDGHIKLIDLDDLTSEEPRCNSAKHNQSSNVVIHPSEPCKYNLKCVANHCDGYNAKHNLQNVHAVFFDKLLFTDINNITQHKTNLTWLKRRLDKHQMTAGMLLKYLYRMDPGHYYAGYSR